MVSERQQLYEIEPGSRGIVLVSLGSHGGHNHEGHEIIRRQAEGIFTPDTYNVILLESSLQKKASSLWLGKVIEREGSVLRGVVIANLQNTRGVYPSGQDIQFQINLWSQDINRSFSVENYRFIDELREQFPVVVHFESCPDELFDSLEKADQDGVNLRKRVISESRKGNVRDAIKFYRQELAKRSQVEGEREAYISDQIVDIASDAVANDKQLRLLVRLGAGHLLSGELAKRGLGDFKVVQEFDLEGSNSSYDVGLFLRVKAGENNLTQDELLRGVLSFLLDQVFTEFAKRSGKSEQQLLEVEENIMRRFSPEDLRQFIKSLPKNGIFEEQLTALWENFS